VKAAVVARSRRATNAKVQLSVGEIAWLLAVPCALLAVAAMAVLGAPLGNLLFSSHGQLTLLPEWRFAAFPKPAEQGRYLIALAAPIVLAVATLMLARKPPLLASRATAALVHASQCGGIAFVAVCVWAQHRLVFGVIYGFSLNEFPHGYSQSYFTISTLLVAAALAAAIVLAVKSDRVRPRVAAALNSRRRAVAVIAASVAVLVTAAWVLAGVNFQDTVGNAASATLYNLKWPLDETFAVLDGRTPLVNFTPQYGALWPYVTALLMSVFGATFTVFSVTMCAITALSLLAVFAVLRRVTGSAVAALALYLPFLANGLFYTEPAGVNRYGPITLYALFPLRYAGPYLLAWLLARHLDGGRPRWRWLLFLAGGIVAVDNTEFGIPAFGATLAALLWVGAPLRWSGIARLLRDALAGLLAAYALVSVVTLLRSGSPVRLSPLFLFARIYGLTGFGDLPTPTLGMHVVIYLTYIGAIGTATVRAITREHGSLLTGLLSWSGVYGLGIGVYYMGRSTPEAVVMMFSAWTFALALLTILAIQQIARHPKRRVTIAHCAVFFGMGVAACSLAQTPAPWSQITRLQARAAPIDVASPALRQLLIAHGGGKPEAIMSVLGHRVAYESGITDISPFAGMISIFTIQQFDETICALRAAGGNLLVLPLANTFEGFYVAARQAGFTALGSSEVDFEAETGKAHGLSLWSAPAVAQQPCGPTGTVTR